MLTPLLQALERRYSQVLSSPYLRTQPMLAKRRNIESSSNREGKAFRKYELSRMNSAEDTTHKEKKKGVFNEDIEAGSVGTPQLAPSLRGAGHTTCALSQ